MKSRRSRRGVGKTWKERRLTKIEIIRRNLNKLPPFLDGYAAIVRAIEDDDVPHAYFLAKELEYSSRVVKSRIFEMFRFIDKEKE